MRRAQVPAGLTALVAALRLSGSPSAASPPNSDRSSFTTTVVMPVPFNRVHAVGSAKVRLQGHRATVTVDVRGLIQAPHAMHIHIKGEGECPEPHHASLHEHRRRP